MRLFVLALLISGCAQVAGPQGPQGNPGNDGQNGLSLVTTVQAASSGQCPYGGNVILVAQDSLGTGQWNAIDHQMSAAIACNGAPGATGKNGTNTTPVTIVPLCTGTSSYPSVFVESALCINGFLYGVYSDNDGFGTVLLPGAYSSNAIGSRCNLTIGANCTVTH